jgi:hypothetical protein
MSRLTQTAYPGNSTVYVETGLDWVSGDKLAFAPTSLRYNDSDYAIVSSYNSQTG